MTRVLSALAMVAVVVGTIAWLPAWATLVLAEAVVLLALVEYAGLAERAGAPVPTGVVVVAGLALCAAVARGYPLVPGLMVLTVIVGALAVSRPGGGHAASVFGPLWVGLPIGSLVAIHAARGAEPILLLMAVIVASDTAQYYGGRTFGRRPLAPATSPKKTVEGAVSGLLAGAVAMAVLGPSGGVTLGPALAVAFGAGLAGVGIVGDLFESRLKRAAGVKDVSGLLPGHGGVLDRLDSWLFAIPLFDVTLRWM